MTKVAGTRHPRVSPKLAGATGLPVSSCARLLRYLVPMSHPTSHAPNKSEATQARCWVGSGAGKSTCKPVAPRGFTLVEMLAVIATGSVLLVIAMSVVHRAMRVDSQWRSQANVNRALTRLAHDFRADVHQCRDIQLTEDPQVLKLTAPDGMVVTYEIAGDEVIRDVQSPGADRRREFYTKPAGYEAEFTIQEEPQWVELRVTRDPQLKGVKARVVLHVAAEASRFARLTQSSGGAP